MNLKTAMDIIEKMLEEKQNPDQVTFTKQWDEFGGLKGWMVDCAWELEKPITIIFDITPHYTRTLGDLNTVPNFIRGKHQTI